MHGGQNRCEVYTSRPRLLSDKVDAWLQMTTMVDMLRAAVFLGHELPNYVQGVELDGIIIMGHSLGAGSGLIIAPHIKVSCLSFPCCHIRCQASHVCRIK